MARRWPVALGLTLSLALAGCVPDRALGPDGKPATAGAMPHGVTPGPAVIPRVEGPTEPFLLDKVTITIPPGTRIGRCHGHPQSVCPGDNGVYWDSGRVRVNPQEFQGLFYGPMTKVGYRVVGDPRQLFENENERAAARYLVGAEIKWINLSVAHAQSWTGTTINGFAQMQVNWQAYSLRERRVVYASTVNAYSTIDRVGNESVIRTLILSAFADAVTRLSAGQRFRQTVAIQPGVTPATETVDAPELQLPAYSPNQGPISGRMSSVRGATVTILQASGHGSGFFISDNGLILTNQHVIGNAEQINVRLPSGVELPGRILRRHIGRDVALIKVELNRVQPLPISLATPPVGSEVYALGTPTDPALAASVTRGIVSALRTIPKSGIDYAMIQSDVAIQGGNSGGPLLDPSGNVVGIAVSGIGLGQTNAGLNFFIPIEDALTYLNIRLGQPRELRF
jgi:serine protease Do